MTVRRAWTASRTTTAGDRLPSTSREAPPCPRPMRPMRPTLAPARARYTWSSLHYTLGQGLAIDDNRFVRLCVVALFFFGFGLPLAAQDDLPNGKGKETLENTCSECHGL